MEAKQENKDGLGKNKEKTWKSNTKEVVRSELLGETSAKKIIIFGTLRL